MSLNEVVVAVVLRMGKGTMLANIYMDITQTFKTIPVYLSERKAFIRPVLTKLSFIG